MQQSQNKNQFGSDNHNKGQHLVSLWFENEILSKSALKILLNKGYERKDFRIIKHQGLFKKPCRVLGESLDSNSAIVSKVITGLKGGAITGIAFAILIISISLLTNITEPSLGLLIYLFVGAIWGATLGFLIMQFFPLNAKQYYLRKLKDSNILIQFNTRNKESDNYFSHMKGRLCQIG